MRRRSGVVAIVVLGLVWSAVPAVVPVGATPWHEASVNPYCQAMIATHPSPPTNGNPAIYHLWAKENLRYFEKLQSEATTAKAKSSLRVLVPILKYEARARDLKRLGVYVQSKETTWYAQWQVFDVTVVACAKWAVNLL